MKHLLKVADNKQYFEYGRGVCMKKHMIFFTAALCLACIATYAQSLGDLARDEQKRRDAISEEKTIILDSAPTEEPEEEIPIANKAASTETENPQGTDAEEEEEDAEEEEYYDDDETGPDEATNLYGKPESYWRNTMSEARDKLKRLEDESKELASTRNALQIRHNRTNVAQRGSVKEEISKTRQAQDVNRKKLEQAREEMQSLHNDARKSGALPGWLD